ncbi:MAG: bifunctional 4-hydroxy-2-oxoglutarate aldolase/2-dehydro-3-deoxy-phosphogluconate aldolase [Anaerolineae bacterium]|nr:bifunctional 4-hydroxy-2-oxoglutarate aldolase/2-dehydro-3-deoxy-phosphogluconate aldolase [Anaerolineae bacterium]MCO5207679.1 bifunctional 4-hydroxy-2-oxoglutarate aldolase/2-dehydro-3-deoxy-phosphogluconate aldolase [Anaerolineae bacterium]
MNKITDQLGQIGIIPVVAIDDAASAEPLGRALLDGGLPCAEITFRTAAAADAIQKMSAAHSNILVGAGTVLTIEQAKQAKAAGAKFIVTPGFDAAVVDWCLANEMPITPGVMTPTDINQALAKGLNILKFFPAEVAGGVKALKAIGGPYVGVKFIPTGGINASNLADYLSLPMVHACGGSFMVEKQLIAAGKFDEIRDLAKMAVNIVRLTRS